MIAHYGFSEKVGIIWHDKNEEFAPETRQLIDEEVRRLLQESYERAKHVIATNREELNVIAAALLEYETLSGSELADLLQGKPINATRRSHKPSQLVTQTPPPVGGSKIKIPLPQTQPSPIPKPTIPVPKPASREPSARQVESTNDETSH